MKLKLPTAAELRTAYRRDLEACFPPDELKPLSVVEDAVRRGEYRPLCLYDGAEIVGECFLWTGSPGRALLDYLCVTPSRQNAGLGGRMLSELRRSGWACILGEVEDPADAPDPDTARRRWGFYERNGARPAGYDTELFGVHYRTLYWAAEEIPDPVLLAEHRLIYRLDRMPEKYRGYFKIPYERTGADHENTGH